MEEPLSLKSVVIASSQLVSCPLGEESAVLHVGNSMYYGLDPVGTRIWELLRKPQSIDELRDAVLREYEVEAERCERDLLEFLTKMREEGLIEVRAAL